MAAWLVQLRSRLLLPADPVAQDAASREAAQLGRDVFARGQPELVGIGAAMPHQVDVIEFRWAALALFDDDLPGPDTMARYRPVWVNLHSIPDARARILRCLTDHQSPRPLDQLLPDLPAPGAPPESKLRGRSRWTSTFVASLELAKQGEVVLEQESNFAPIFIHADRAEKGCSDDT